MRALIDQFLRRRQADCLGALVSGTLLIWLASSTEDPLAFQSLGGFIGSAGALGIVLHLAFQYSGQSR